ncbi:membrane-associated PAP2 superfamily phosphatase [Janthinobacterium sp. CG_23.3]
MPAAMPSKPWRRLQLRVWPAMLAAALLIAWIGAGTDIDLALADAAFDARLGGFPWRDAWLADAFSHVILKRLMVALGLAAVGAAAWDLVRPRPWSPLRRLQQRLVALSALLVPGIIATLKQLSSSHCPWDLQRYGGTQAYIRLLETVPHGVPAGHCMPGGHASSALWLISLALFFLPRRPRTAALALALLLAVGASVGWLQQLRGAHFLTHTLWSMWLACAIVFALAGWLDRDARLLHTPNQR